MAAGLPTEGTNTSTPRAGDLVRRAVPTCTLDERVGDVRARAEAAGWSTAVVVNEERVVLGLLREQQLGADASALVEQAMRPGPSTFRPFAAIAEMAHYTTDDDLVSSPITSDGRLVGLLLREDAVHAAHVAGAGAGSAP